MCKIKKNWRNLTKISPKKSMCVLWNERQELFRLPFSVLGPRQDVVCRSLLADVV